MDRSEEYIFEETYDDVGEAYRRRHIQFRIVPEVSYVTVQTNQHLALDGSVESTTGGAVSHCVNMRKFLGDPNFPRTHAHIVFQPVAGTYTVDSCASELSGMLDEHEGSPCAFKATSGTPYDAYVVLPSERDADPSVQHILPFQDGRYSARYCSEPLTKDRSLVVTSAVSFMEAFRAYQNTNVVGISAEPTATLDATLGVPLKNESATGISQSVGEHNPALSSDISHSDQSGSDGDDHIVVSLPSPALSPDDRGPPSKKTRRQSRTRARAASVGSTVQCATLVALAAATLAQASADPSNFGPCYNGQLDRRDSAPTTLRKRWAPSGVTVTYPPLERVFNPVVWDGSSPGNDEFSTVVISKRSFESCDGPPYCPPLDESEIISDKKFFRSWSRDNPTYGANITVGGITFGGEPDNPLQARALAERWKAIPYQPGPINGWGHLVRRWSDDSYGGRWPGNGQTYLNRRWLNDPNRVVGLEPDPWRGGREPSVLWSRSYETSAGFPIGNTGEYVARDDTCPFFLGADGSFCRPPNIIERNVTLKIMSSCGVPLNHTFVRIQYGRDPCPSAQAAPTNVMNSTIYNVWDRGTDKFDPENFFSGDLVRIDQDY